MKQEVEQVRLSPDELKRAQASAKASLAQLEYIGQLVFEKLGRRTVTLGENEITQIRIDPNAGVIAFSTDGDSELGCVQYRDPPGVCEPCPK
ncbi:hypothetical protein STRCI_008610 [Streptomyces cinnabarinus]|uniref:Uncharacterized protein n=1 Tax=Streptomyces cinnabarinus TaxID=67287 RepID=A0ABY7KTT0_9ACTN|nr:hypothetical protein [Streptomyces cinnabarinus]WAZ26928.1 hypothetical protein STRCI_008610 [Streptomyces cinnabarinus]